MVLLQEVDDGVPRSRGDRQVDIFADALAMRYRAYQCNVSLTRGHYGNAILSRFPLTDTRNIDLTIPLKPASLNCWCERKFALATQMKTGHCLPCQNTEMDKSGEE